MTSYKDIYDRFLRRVEDHDLAELCEEDFYDTLFGYLQSAISRFRKCRSDLSLRDEEAACFVEDLLDIEQEILALLMARAWVEPQLKSDLITRQAWSGKETNFYSQASHMDKLQALYNDTLIDAHKLQRDYTYSAGATSYFDE